MKGSLHLSLSLSIDRFVSQSTVTTMAEKETIAIAVRRENDGGTRTVRRSAPRNLLAVALAATRLVASTTCLPL